MSHNIICSRRCVLKKIFVHLGLNIDQWILVALMVSLFAEHFKTFAHFKRYLLYYLGELFSNISMTFK